MHLRREGKISQTLVVSKVLGRERDEREIEREREREKAIS